MAKSKKQEHVEQQRTATPAGDDSDKDRQQRRADAQSQIEKAQQDAEQQLEQAQGGVEPVGHPRVGSSTLLAGEEEQEQQEAPQQEAPKAEPRRTRSEKQNG